MVVAEGGAVVVQQEDDAEEGLEGEGVKQKSFEGLGRHFKKYYSVAALRTRRHRARAHL